MGKKVPTASKIPLEVTTVADNLTGKGKFQGASQELSKTSTTNFPSFLDDILQSINRPPMVYIFPPPLLKKSVFLTLIFQMEVTHNMSL